MLTLRTRALSASATARAARHAAGAMHTLAGQTNGAAAAAASSAAALLHRHTALPLPRAALPVTAAAAVRSSLLPSSGSHRSLHTSSSLRLSSSDKDAPPPGPGDGDDAVPPEEDDNEHEQSVEAAADEDAEGKDVDGGDENEDINSLLGGEDAEGFDAEAAEAAEDADEPPQNLKPSELVTHLDRYIVGQFAAKKSVAVALRNRWRRHSVRASLRPDITPKNILMVGPTGCGKTEIARRLALVTDSPFIKVEATKFTEVGFYGKDVDTIIRDLVRVAINNLKAKKRTKLAKIVGVAVENTLLDALHETRARSQQGAATTGSGGGVGIGSRKGGMGSSRPTAAQVAADREALRKGELDSTMVDIEVPLPKQSSPLDMLGGGGGGNGGGDEEGGRGGGGGGISSGFASFEALGGMKAAMGGGSGMERRHMSIGEARPLLIEHAISSRIRTRDLAKKAIKQVESDGIVFLDEIDKICSSAASRRFSSSADASAEGVQRDLLPLVEGTTVTTPHGPVQTDHILFICSGAFHHVNVGDMLPELQGRLPIRVELKALTEEDFYRILTVPTNNLIKQQVALLNTDNVELSFSDGAVREIARVSFEVNRTLENIGARRLNTVIQRIMDEHSFTAADQPAGTKIVIDVDYVREKIKPLLKNADLSKYVL